MVVWETFRNLNLGPAIYPVVIMGRDYWLRQEPRSNERGQWDGWKAEEPKGIVGNSFEVCISQGTVGDTCDDDDILEEWARGAPPVDYKDIVWLTRPNHKELQLFFMTVSSLRPSLPLLLQRKSLLTRPVNTVRQRGFCGT